ncbi:MAG: 50S ribosomal protein L21 [Pelagibacteraceae bacterium]|jgi:large subunit ribosomal protein L21|nr:50S ribosomal protein L21 [Pseudomonadota bacterium]NCW79944.1 50S ribosomal protein L21 [Pelagibacteraceae bacterium]
MTFAVINTGGKQYKVSANDKLRLEKLSTNEGEVVEFDQVLLTNKDNEIDIGEPIVEGAKVQGKILNQTKNRTVIVFKKRRRQNSRRKKGHRQQISVVQIMKIFGKNGKLLSEASLEKKETVKTKEDKENKTVEKTTK